METPRAYRDRHAHSGISMQQAKLCLRRKRLDVLLADAEALRDPSRMLVALRMIVEDTYPRDLDA